MCCFPQLNSLFVEMDHIVLEYHDSLRGFEYYGVY